MLKRSDNKYFRLSEGCVFYEVEGVHSSLMNIDGCHTNWGSQPPPSVIKVGDMDRCEVSGGLCR